ncbi:pyruvate kinase [Stanieria cyanosphaera PCC 7437]|uniref:Pyruvate kinase n=1 Tax=Stanieria cyanosphaera (strain ATCC 29371 / PCC 7437) TaxID=111780 RepID=K9XPK9_STAC7|nr:pyruvate kinase [Stanieria cyanosphaera]AFZ33991.1 pyruvate kinase [Stanieria cyanosphaera PCC 7437]
MISLNHRTKIVATIGPASNSPEIIKQMIEAGMSVARLNFSHGTYEDHAKTVHLLRSVAEDLDTPITLLQDLQGPKIRVGYLPNNAIALEKGATIDLVPLFAFNSQPDTVPIDYPYLAEEAEIGAKILLDDGLLELTIVSIEGSIVKCQVVEGGQLKSRKGVNLPNLTLKLPSLTEKDEQDLEFGISQGIDIVALSFVRRAEDLKTLKQLLTAKGSDLPVIAKIEKPQAIANLKEILDQCDGLMVARGDLGVEMRPERVPMLQKEIIRQCNLRNIPVITATQMLESMINNPYPTRAEASDVANAIIDGTDAVMLSGESAVGNYPIKAVQMLARIATDVEPEINFVNNPPAGNDETHALSEALNAIDSILNLRCIVTFTSSGYTALLASGERPQSPVVAFTPNLEVYHRLNLIWGVKPILLDREVITFEELVTQAETLLLQRNLVVTGDHILIMGGIPTQIAGGTNFLKIHTIK